MPEIGNQIYIRTGHALAHCAVGITGVAAIVTNESDRGVELHAIDESGRMATTRKGKPLKAWLPKKALKANGGGRFELAHWFRPAGWTAVWFDMAAMSSTVAA